MFMYIYYYLTNCHTCTHTRYVCIQCFVVYTKKNGCMQMYIHIFKRPSKTLRDFHCYPEICKVSFELCFYYWGVKRDYVC